jgi:DNA-binding MarR family transcriptional regulator
MPLPTADEIANMPGFLIRRCNQISMALFLEETAGQDLTPAQYGALALIAAEPGMDQTRLTDRSALDRSSVTKCVERLEARGMIRRDMDAKDRRVRQLHITEEGLSLLNDVEAAVKRAQDRIIGPLGEERAKLFLAMLQEVASANNPTSRVPMQSGGRG